MTNFSSPPNGDSVAFNIASFICALFVLEFGADKFIDHTAIVARRTGISQALIGLLTAGAEWEELVVVVASVVRKRSSIALGNIIGSSISNILGAFSLGLLFHSTTTTDVVEFDRSAKVYSLLLLLLSAFVSALTLVGGRTSTWAILGGILLAIFVLYVVSVAWAIGQRAITAPELSSDSDGDEDDDDHDDGREESASARGGMDHIITGTGMRSQASQDIEDPSTTVETGRMLEERNGGSTHDCVPRHSHHSLKYHIGFVTIGFLSICLSGYVLSHSSTTISDEIGTSDVLFGVVILSTATTLPEKLIAVISGSRGHTGILVANTVGSNIFLLTLCMGIVWIVTAGEFDAGSINAAEVGVMMASTVALNATVWFGAKWIRWIGAAMLIAYVVFLVLEFMLIRKV